MKRTGSLILAIVMVITMIPLTVSATEEYVYMSVSYDDKYINDKAQHWAF